MVNIYPTCNNKQCKKKLSVPAGAVVVTCATCKRKLLSKKAMVEVNVSRQLENAEENQQTVTIFKSILVELFGEQFLSEAPNDSDILLERLLSWKNMISLLHVIPLLLLK